MLLLALLTYDANDPSFNLVRTGGEANNKAGLFGAYASGFLDDIFGVGALVWPFVFAALGLAYLRPGIHLKWSRWWGYFLLSLCLLTLASSADLSVGDLKGGGVIGAAFYYNGARYLSPVGSFFLWLFVFMIGAQLAGGFSWINLFHNLREKWRTRDKSGGKSLNLKKARELPKALFERVSSLAGKLSAEALKAKLARVSRPPRSPLPEPSPAPTQADDDPLATAEIIVNPSYSPLVTDPEPEDPEVESAEIRGDVEEPREEEPEIVVLPASEPEEKPEEKAPVAEPEEEAPQNSFFAREELEDNLPDAEEEENLAPLPSTELLVSPGEKYAHDPELLRSRGRALMECLNNFDVKGELARVTPGPVITTYEVRPAPGTKVSKISGLSDDLALALKAVTVRIQAPIPGSDTVGVEIPNEKRETVNFRELAETEDFQKNPGALPMILGKDVAGAPYMADLAKMPHLLVAGSTGAGKSVCLNSIIISLLYKTRPEDMRLMLIDPKRIEMGVYADMPHLVHPVVTEMSDAKNALDWAVHEMERRFKTMKILGARDITSYNKKLAGVNREYSPEMEELEPFPYLVIIIDELADLMMTAARDVESSIVRLGQLGRAGGIHMILATQRPSVDVVTSLIKTNMGSRISFQVMSKYDSRTILDQVGAEKLLGKGDMLFKPTSGGLRRLHGPFLSDDEVRAVVDYWKGLRKPTYDVDFARWNGDKGAREGGGAPDNAVDALYDEAKAFTLAQGKVSISLLQRHLRIGFVRAARIVEQFERDGIVGPADGSKPREVIR